MDLTKIQIGLYFHESGNTFIREGCWYDNTVEHEINHKLGTINIADNTRGVNEAATELFSLEAKGDSSNGKSGYNYNVDLLKSMKKSVDEVVHRIPGYENTDLLKLSYTDNTYVYDSAGTIIDKKGLFFDAMDDIMESSDKLNFKSSDYIPFSERVISLMDIVDGGKGGKQYTIQERKMAIEELNMMDTQLYAEVLKRSFSSSIDLK